MPLNNFGMVNNLIARSAQPDETGIYSLVSIGFYAVLKLNTEQYEQEQQACYKAGLQLVYKPIPTELNSVGTIKEIAEQIKSLSAAGRILVHCEHGRDRTGLVVGAYRILYNGYSLEQVDAERKVYGVDGLIKVLDSPMEVIFQQLINERGAM
jgi:protein-tyrosine phosphatase